MISASQSIRRNSGGTMTAGVAGAAGFVVAEGLFFLSLLMRCKSIEAA